MRIFNKKIEEPVNSFSTEEQKEEIKNKKEPYYIWVEGFKGTTAAMTAHGDFQYELGKQYDFDGEPELCESGFHFCEELSSVFAFYQLNGRNRFFRVKALVVNPIYRTKDENSFRFNVFGCNDKLTAKCIILKEELSYENLSNHIKYLLPLVENEEEYKLCGEITYDKFASDKFRTIMVSLGYSSTFIDLVYKIIPSSINGKGALMNKLELAKALHEEGVSKDMAVYLLLNQGVK